MLQTYRNQPEIGMITGINFQKGVRRGSGDYYFSKYMHIWGWATWSDRWLNSYDVDMKAWPTFKRSQDFLDITVSAPQQKFWEKIFEKVYHGKIDTWDYQWILTLWRKGALSCRPTQNLVKNIGLIAIVVNTLLILIYIASLMIAGVHTVLILLKNYARKK